MLSEGEKLFFFIVGILFSIILLGFCSKSYSQTFDTYYVEAHIGSQHLKSISPATGEEFNEFNPGIGGELLGRENGREYGFGVGGYYNSYEKASFYASGIYRWCNGEYNLCAGVKGGFITGYDDLPVVGNVAVPLVTLQAMAGLTDDTRLAVTFIPPYTTEGAVFALSIQKKLGFDRAISLPERTEFKGNE